MKRNKSVGAGLVPAQCPQRHAKNNVGARWHATQKGITLISLIITIIILLILAGVTINFAIGENGIFRLAQNATEKYENSAEKEQYDLAQLGDYIENGRQNETVIKEEYEKLNNFKTIYSSSDQYQNSITYTLEKEYPMIIILVSSIGDSSGTYLVNSSISVSNTKQKLVEIMQNGRKIKV